MKYKLLLILALQFFWTGAFSQNIFEIQGSVKNLPADTFITNMKVKLLRSDGEIFETFTNDSGFYKFGTEVVLDNMDYEIIMGKNGVYLCGKGTESSNELEVSTRMVHDFELYSYYPPGELPFIKFSKAKKTKSSGFLELLKFIKENPEEKVILVTYEKDRKKLKGEKKAKLLIEFLVNEGISESRIETNNISWGKAELEFVKIMLNKIYPVRKEEETNESTEK